MQSDQVEPFPDNWTYLKTELNWLDRVLMLAIARQRKETKEVERIAQSRADRISSHWWKGLITLDGDVAYDDCRSPAQLDAPKVSYQQQTEARIQASFKRGIVLALPLLRDRLKLTVFEKNLVLLSLGAEVNRRYSRIYSYLQGSEADQPSLPTVDLVLRLFCRNDVEWRTARNLLWSSSPLLKYGLLEVLANSPSPLLNRSIKLAEPLIGYLLADTPDATRLDMLLQPAKLAPRSLKFLNGWTPVPAKPRSSKKGSKPQDLESLLVLPPSLLAALQHLCDRVQLRSQVDEAWGFGQAENHPVAWSAGNFTRPAMPGTVSLLVGAPGTGKTVAAQAIAQFLKMPLFSVDLAFVKPGDYPQLLQEIVDYSPVLLLLKSAQLWFGRNAALSTAELHQFLYWRKHNPGLTLLTVRVQQSVRLQWRQQLDQVLEFPLPSEADRLRLWQQAFPPQAPLDADIDWEFLARQFPLSGGEIRSIAREAAFYAAAEAGDTKLGMRHLIRAWEQSLKKLKMKN